MSQSLLHKTVFITGGLSGIGLACAYASARAGATIALIDRVSAGTSDIMSELNRLSPSAFLMDCDVTNFDQVGKAVLQIKERIGVIDVALNNAGIGGKSALIGEMDEKSWRAVIDVNLNGVFNCMHHELALMSEQKRGVIVNMSSILGKVGFRSSAHYVASKHAVIGLTEAAALEYAEMGIRVNAICPGFIDTPMLASAGMAKGSDLRKMIEEMHPLKRLGLIDEVAKAFVFLASDDSSFVTGTSLAVDGGYLAQ
jgi:NAD(P)-dependent dehydrogenase (short-subunit alcohol dehydrogenase family)